LYQAFARRRGLCVTSDYVLDEVMTLLFRRAPFLPAKVFTEAIFAAVEAGAVDLQRVTADRFRRAWDFRVRYADKPLISFTDLTSFVLMTEAGVRDVLTEDRHFELVGLGLRCVP
jgi:predicted nucleic acid-binding protein